ncbi:hypothetical protein HK097_002533 [Rhizophlyctis rosea]|uniref:FAD-binding FR-type domain-containing protein n=1 Tax=Rhizophlyctis rosea TaxID=64517 RepID=A0AAD5X378_9FUNG|nr:hypothetical protein HK097_002533 [Rhizophlyctis rosea]
MGGLSVDDPTVPVPKGGASLILAWSIAGRNVLIVGGNDAAASRAFFALEADASVTLVTPDCHLTSSQLRTRVDRGELAWFNRSFEERDLDSKHLVFITAENESLARHVAIAAKQRKVPVNVLDAADASDFHFMSTYRDHALQIAVSTNGNGPKLASRIRRQIASSLPPNAGLAIQRLSALRQRIRSADPSPSSTSRRLRFINSISEAWPLEKLADLSDSEISHLVHSYVSGADHVAPHYVRKSEVKIVGAAVADPELLTRKAYNALASADLVVADSTVSREILDIVGGELVVLQVAAGRDHVELQLEGAVLSALKDGKDVVRVVAGDVAFGSAAEDIALFQKHGYSPVVLPGVSASVAAPLAAGIPLSKGTAADQLLFLSASQDGRLVNVPSFSATRTLVVDITTSALPQAVADLSSRGYPSELPVAVVPHHQHRAIRATISTLLSILKKDTFNGAATVVIGYVIENSIQTALSHKVEHVQPHTAVPRSVTKFDTYVPPQPREVTASVSIKKTHNTRLGSVQQISGQTAVSHVAYALSDLSFVYPVASTHTVGLDIARWSSNNVKNAFGTSHKTINMSTRTGAATVVHGALSAGAHATSVLSSEALPLMIPSMYHIASARKPVVFHVATQAATENHSVVSDYSDVMAASYTGFGLLGSGSVQEGHDLAVISHVAAHAAKHPVLHFFDGARIARESVKASVLDFTDLNTVVKSVAENVKGVDGFANVVERVMYELKDVLGHAYQVFEFVGARDAEVVVVVLGPAAELVEAAVHKLVKAGKKVGVLKVRLYRPWSAHHFLQALPKGVKKIAVVDQTSGGGAGHGPLYLDVTGSFYTGNWTGPVPAVINGRFKQGSGNYHPAAVDAVFQTLLSHQPVYGFSIALEGDDVSEADAKYVGEGVRQAVFWDAQEKETAAVGEAVTRYLAGQHQQVQSFVTHDAAQIVPVKITNLRFGSAETSPSLIRSADYGGVHDLEILQRYNVALSVKHRGVLVLNTGLKGAELEKEIPEVVKAEIVRRNLKVYAIDANQVAKDWTWFKGKFEEYVSLVLKSVFFKLAPGIDFAGAMKAVGEGVSGEKDYTIFRTKLGAVQRGLELLNTVDTAKWDVTYGGEKLPAFAEGTHPFDKVHLVEEEDLEPKAKHVKWHHAAWPVLFPEAYGVEKKLRPDVEDAHLVNVTENVRLTPKEYERNVFHLEMDILDGMRYEIGDALGVHGHNDPEHVAIFLKAYGLNPDDVVMVERKTEDGRSTSEVRTVNQMFTQVVDLFGKPGRKFYQALVDHAKDPKERVLLADLLSNAEDLQLLTDEETPTYADLLERFPSARPSLEDLLALIPAIKPRHYSIASAQSMHPNSVHLLIVLVDWKTKSGALRFGQCTRYLVHSKVGQQLCVSIKPSVMKLPKSLMAPVIMSGLGTGMAPFRAFIEERAYWRAQGKQVGPMVLYFGSRNRANEYLYGEELEAYHADGLLTHLRLAFSRDQKEKVYIQHKILEDQKLLEGYVMDEQGAFYLCGPTWPVPDVRDALVGAFEPRIGKKRAVEYLEELKEEDRYILEVY